MELLTLNFQGGGEHRYAQSSMLHVLSHFEPNLYKKNTDRHYQKKTVVDLFSDVQPDLFKMIWAEIEDVANKVGMDVEWFSTDGYLAMWKDNFTKFLDENPKIRKSLDLFKSDSADPAKQFDMLIGSLSQLSRLLRTSYDEWHKSSMAEFLDSNLPSKLYNLYSISYIAKVAVIESIVSNLKHLRDALYRVRSDEQKIKNELAGFKKKIDDVLELLLQMSRSETTIKFYLYSKNAKTLDDFFRTIPLKLDVDSDKQFQEYLKHFNDNLFVLITRMDKKQFHSAMKMNAINSKMFVDLENDIRTLIVQGL